MTTVLQIIDRALEHIQVKAAGETTSADDADMCLRALTSMLDAWQLDTQAIVGLTELTFTPAAGAQSVTIGPDVADPGTDPDIVVTTMPARIEDSSFVRVNGVDTPLVLCPSFADYAHQASKAVQGSPWSAFYMRGDTDGELYLWPAADGATELHLWVRLEVVAGQTALALADTLALPSGYRSALEYGLAAELCPSFTRPEGLTVQMQRRAMQAMRRLKRGNFQSQQLETLPGQRWDIRVG